MHSIIRTVCNSRRKNNSAVKWKDRKLTTEVNDTREVETAFEETLNRGHPNDPVIISPMDYQSDIKIAAAESEDLFGMIRYREVVPKDWNRGLIVKLPQKRDLTIRDNYRGINLLSVPSEAFTRVIINQICDKVNKRSEKSKLASQQEGAQHNSITTS